MNSNYRGVQNLIFLFNILTGARKDFFKTYRKFGYPPSKRFASPGLECSLVTISTELSQLPNSLNSVYCEIRNLCFQVCIMIMTQSCHSGMKPHFHFVGNGNKSHQELRVPGFPEFLVTLGKRRSG